jgi:hypothetical protein
MSSVKNDILTKPDKIVIFCLPGNNYSNKFLVSWSNLLFECIRRNIRPIISQNHSSCVHFARMLTLCGDNLKGPNQIPFEGRDYTHIMMIDSDIIFNVESFFTLLESPYDVTGGMYMMENCKQFPIVKEWDEDFFKKHGSFEFMTPEDIEKTPKVNEKYFKCSYNGLGFMLFKKGVIDKIKYPWFHTDLQQIGNVIDMSSEDVSLCRNLQEAGVEIYVDSTVRVGHLKSFII